MRVWKFCISGNFRLEIDISALLHFCTSLRRRAYKIVQFRSFQGVSNRSVYYFYRFLLYWRVIFPISESLFIVPIYTSWIDSPLATEAQNQPTSSFLANFIPYITTKHLYLQTLPIFYYLGLFCGGPCARREFKMANRVVKMLITRPPNPDFFHF